MPRRIARALLIGLAATLTIGLSVVGTGVAEAKPTFKITTVVTGRNIPWDLTWVGDLMIFDERGGGLWSKRGMRRPGGSRSRCRPRTRTSEGVGSGWSPTRTRRRNNRFYLCQTYERNGDPVDVRVLRLRLLTDTSAVAGRRRSAWWSTGFRSAAAGTAAAGCGSDPTASSTSAPATRPEDQQPAEPPVARRQGAPGQLATASIPTDNPFYGRGRQRPLRLELRSSQRPGPGRSARAPTSCGPPSTAPDRDDEINLNCEGANYGWDPRRPGYDESTPMTDLTKFPDATPAKWSSGAPTVATSGITFLNSSAWGHWQGALAVGLLAGQGIRVLFLDPDRNESSARPTIAGLGKYRPDPDRAVGPGRRALLHHLQRRRPRRDRQDHPDRQAAVGRAPADNVSAVGVSAVRTGNDIYAFIRTTGNRVALQAQHRRRPHLAVVVDQHRADQRQRTGRRVLRRRSGRPGHPNARAARSPTPGSSTASRRARPASAARCGPRPSPLSATARSTCSGCGPPAVSTASTSTERTGRAGASWPAGGFTSAVGASADPVDGGRRC